MTGRGGKMGDEGTRSNPWIHEYGRLKGKSAVNAICARIVLINR